MNRLAKLVYVLAAMVAGASHGAPILLKAKTIVPGKETGRVRVTSTSSTSGQSEVLPERGLYIVQHDGIIQPAWRESLEAVGAIIRSYIPENAYLVEASPAVHEAIRTTIPHTYLGEYKGEYRYDVSSIASLQSGTRTTSSSSGVSSPTKEFSILLFTEECRDEIVAKIGNLACCSVSGADGKVIRAALTAAAVKDVASWPDVDWVEEFVLPTLCNNVAVQAPRMNVETVWPDGDTGLELSGKGQIVAVADTGLDTGNLNTVHEDVKDRIVKAFGLGRINDWSDPNGHGTHVAGSVVGNGAKSNGSIKGVAYSASIVFQSTQDKDGHLTGIPNDLNTLFAQAYDEGARIHSNSWGSGRQDDGTVGGNDAYLGLYGNGVYVLGRYVKDSYQIDEFMFNHPDMLILFAAGNDGVDWSPQDGIIDKDSIGCQPTAKNCITVGASENYRTTGGYSKDTWSPWIKFNKDCFPNNPIASDLISRSGDNVEQGMAAFSSRGPCDDGRIKPDIVAPGTDILSLRSSVGKTKWGTYDYYYQYCGGTSMACPLVAGSAALVREWLQTKHTPNITNPDGATIKAILLAGAKSLAPGQYGEGKTQEIPKSYPNNVEGWGQVNLGNSLQNSAGLLVYDAKVIVHGKTHTYTVNATAGKALNIVMAYTDAPGNPGVGPALVNDLDLLVKTPNGKLIYPNSRTQEQGADNLNNVEGVRVAAGDVVTGTYTITVTGTNINTGMDPSIILNGRSLTDGKSNAIRYSLVVNGATEKDPVPDPPANDDIANANTITLQNGYTSGSNVAATKDNGGIGGYASVWWKWTVSKSGTATLDTEGSSFDTTLMVYTKLANGTYKLVRENNDANASVSYSRVEFETTAETTYYVAVGGVSGKTGNIRLNYGLQLVQKPDLCFALGSGNSSWPAAVFLSNARGSTTPETSFKSRQTIYTYWSSKNTGNVSVKSGFVVLHEILKSGTVVQTWTESLSATDESSRSNNPDSHFKNLGQGSYTYRITLDSQNAIDELNENNNVATYSFSVAAPTPLSMPTNLQVDGRGMSGLGLNFVKIYWDPVYNDDGKQVEGYYVYRNTSPSMPDQSWKTKTGAGPVAVVDATCKAGTTYYYWVVAFDGVARSSPSSYVSITPTADGSGDTFKPTASISGSTVVLSWTADESWIRDFYVYRSTEPIMPENYLASVSSDSRSYPDNSATPGDTYYYWVVMDHMLMGEICSDAIMVTLPAQKSDLGFYHWSAWPQAVFLAAASDFPEVSTSFLAGQLIYLYRCWGNFGAAPVTSQWAMRHQVLVRGTETVVASGETVCDLLTAAGTQGWASYGIEAHDFLQNLPGGSYTYRCTLDSGNVLSESDESNNIATFDFDVVSENCDIEFCGYEGWLEQLFLSPEGANGAYIPVHRYAEGGSPRVVFGVVNWQKTTCLCHRMSWRISDVEDNTVKYCDFEWNKKFDADHWNSNEGATGGWGWPSAFGNLVPGVYSLQVVLDSGMEANDANWNNNTNMFIFAVTNAPSKTIASALEADNLSFMTGGNNPPFVQAQVSSDGADAVQFGPAAPNETNTLSTVVTGPGRLSFRWFCACESMQSAEGHRFAFYVDGVMKRRIYGDGRPDGWKWISYTCDVPAGQHTLSWAYCKDAYADKYLDSAWLDQMSWTPYITPVMPTAKSISGDESGVRITFGSSANATGYRIYRAATKSLPNDNYDEIPASSGTTLEYSDISASPGVEYHYWISAVGTGGESDAVYCGMAYRMASIDAFSDEVSFDANGGEANVSVWANADWEVQSKPSWLTATKTTIESGDRSEVVLRISVGSASSAQDGTISLVAANGSAHPAYIEIHVSQSYQVDPPPPPSTCVVTFNGNGGSGAMASQTVAKGVATNLDKCTFTKTGYSFKKWCGSDGNTYGDQQSVTLSVDLALTAQWTGNVYRVTLDWQNGIGGSSHADATYDAAMPTITPPTRTGYTFGGYFTEENGAGVKYYNADGTSAHVWDQANRATFYAYWISSNESAHDVLLSVRLPNTADIVMGKWHRNFEKAKSYAEENGLPFVAVWSNGNVCGPCIYFARWCNDPGFTNWQESSGIVFWYGCSDDFEHQVGSSAYTWTKSSNHNFPFVRLWWADKNIDVAISGIESELGGAGATFLRKFICKAFGFDIPAYTISFDWNGWEDGPAIEDIVVEPGEEIRLPYSELHTSESEGWSRNREGVRPGYSFGWWNESGENDDPPLLAYYTPERSITLKAIWHPHSYLFRFNANGGKPASSEFYQRYGDDWAPIDVPTLANAVFDGWWTEKTGGDQIDTNDVCSTVGKLGGTMTLYAHWRKMYKATVKDGMVSKDVENYAANITVLSGTDLYLVAADKSDKNMVFSKWTVAPAADLGENYNPRDPYTSFAMPDAAVTFTANYVAAPGYVEVSAYEVNDTANDDGDPEGIEWSDDGKVWTPVGDGEAYPVKSGKVTLQFRSTDPRWTVPAKETYQIVEDEPREIEVAATRVVVVDVAAENEHFGASGTVAMTPKNGQVLPGKPVSLTAKPGKDTVFAYWLVDGKKVGYTATFKYAPDLDVVATAVFRLKSAVAAPVLAVDEVVPSANAMVGVGFEMSVPISDAAYPAKFAATKLPAGLKIDAASGTISGVPTKAGEAAVTISSTGGPGGKAKSSITVPIVIRPLPEWAQGTFTGYALDGYEDDVGMVTFSVSAAGKVSGKMSLCGTNWTFAANSYDVSSKTDSAGAEEFAIRSELKAGKIARPLSLCVSAEPSHGDGGLCNARASEDADDAIALAIFAWRGMWKDKATAAEAKAELAKWEGVYTISFEDDGDCGCGYLSLTVGKDGNVKATGKLADGTSVSATSPLMYSGEAGYFAYFYSAPTAYKGGAFALTVSFAEPRGELGNDIGVAYWTSRNPEATDNYGNGFVRGLEFAGAYYNKLESLYGYYRSLRVDMEDAPELPFSYKETYLDENNRKVTESWIDYAVAIDGLLQQPGLTAAVNEKGAIVVAKATKPVQDKTTKEWAYDGANDGALTLSFTQATGIFKGSYTFWYDYESAYDDTTGKSTMAHTSKKVSFEGILVQGEEPKMDGFYLWDATGVYEDPKTKREKTYKYKESYPVRLER